jgi:hypothetical protein
MNRLQRALGALALILVTLAAESAPKAILDRRTGATVMVSERPWLLALEQPHLAANARDYAALYAVEINIAGKRREHLAVFFWSTIGNRRDFAKSQPRVSLRIDDRIIKLEPLKATARELGISEWPLKPPGRGATLVIYEADPAMLRQLSVAKICGLRVETEASPEDVWFEEWQDGRRAFAEFAREALL